MRSRAFAAGVKQQIERHIRLGQPTPQIVQHLETVMLRQPVIRGGDQQIDIGIRSTGAASPGTVAAGFSAGLQPHLRPRDCTMDHPGHGLEPFLDRGR